MTQNKLKTKFIAINFYVNVEFYLASIIRENKNETFWQVVTDPRILFQFQRDSSIFFNECKLGL